MPLRTSAAANDSILMLALPSKGELEEPTRSFLASCGLAVFRPNDRQYLASIPSAPGVTVLFQRATDIVGKVLDGSADLGITGYDVLHEQSAGHDDLILLFDRLGYGGCALVIGVPDNWLDVSSIQELADLTVLFKEKGKKLRIATKFPRATSDWLYERGITNFTLVEAQGALEAAPSIGFADIIADLTTSGTTLRENRLKQIGGGTILTSEACLIGNLRALKEHPDKREVARMIMELIEARLRAKKYVSLTANIQGESPEAIQRQLMTEKDLMGLHGPTISKVYSRTWGDEGWYAVTIVVRQEALFRAVNHLRKAGGADITVQTLNYVFAEKSERGEQFLEKLRRS
jgi:ATP phosphoribosyltransferase